MEKITVPILASKESELRDAKLRASIAYANMCQARADIESAKEEMAKYFKDSLRVQDEYKSLWARYTKIKHTYGLKIQYQNRVNRMEHSEMNRCLRWSESAFTYGDIEGYEECKEEASIHQEKRDLASKKVAEYIGIIKAAKKEAVESEANIICRRYYEATAKFKDAENRYGANHEDFYHLEDKIKRLEVELKEAKSEYRRRRKKLAKFKKEEEARKLKILKASGIPEGFYCKAKIKSRKEGGVLTHHIFYNTVGSPDGDHHGHCVVEEVDGEFRKPYHRPPLSEHGRQNVVDPNED